MESLRRPVGVDLFCGAGGMSLGFEQAGIEVVAAVDSDPVHAETHAKNFPDCRTLCADLSQLAADELRIQTGLNEKQIDVLFGGPPCQGFSVIGKRRTDDPRNLLLHQFARLVNELRPSYFVVENVQGLLIGEARRQLETFLHQVEGYGYSVATNVQTLDASDFGVPQRRRRVFILGYDRGLPSPEYPPSTLIPKVNGNSHQPTVWDAIGDLQEIDASDEVLKSDVYRGELGPASRYARVMRGEMRDSEDHSRLDQKNGDGSTGHLRTAHTPQTIQRFAATLPGEYEPISRFYRLSQEGLANTLRAGTGSSRGSFTAPRPIHPVSPRCISVREAARLHSFPDWFRFHPTIWHGFRQVGNSVPPLLGRAVGKMIRESLMARG